MPCGNGADQGEPSQQLRERLAPSRLMEHCQWGAQNNSTGWLPDGFTMHLEVTKVVKLLMLTRAPLFPCAQGAKLAPSKVANRLLGKSDCLRLDGLHDHSISLVEMEDSGKSRFG
mgnify:CR=1 FL=1